MLGSERLVFVLVSPSWSSQTRVGLSGSSFTALAVVADRAARGGRRRVDTFWNWVNEPLSCRPPVTASAARVSSLSRFFSRSCPPSVAHLRMVCMRWFCCRGLDRYSSICAWMHFSRSPIMACAVRAMMGVRCVPRFRSYSRIFPVASKPPCCRSVSV